MRFTFFAVLLIFLANLNSLEKNIPVTPLSTSVIIPCHYTHIYLIPKLLEKYTSQSTLPDEVVISLSSSVLVSKKILNKILQTTYPFPVNIIQTQKRLYAGENRNVASMQARGDILIYNDADDLPTFRRVEVIKYFFENYKVDHLIHEYAEILSNGPDSYSRRGPQILDNIDLTEIKFSNNPHIEEVLWYKWIHNGNIAIRKEVINEIKWPSSPRAQDVAFNRLVYNKPFRPIVIRTPLILYHSHLSAQTGEY